MISLLEIIKSWSPLVGFFDEKKPEANLVEQDQQDLLLAF